MKEGTSHTGHSGLGSHQGNNTAQPRENNTAKLDPYTLESPMIPWTFHHGTAPCIFDQAASRPYFAKDLSQPWQVIFRSKWPIKDESGQLVSWPLPPNLESICNFNANHPSKTQDLWFVLKLFGHARESCLIARQHLLLINERAPLQDRSTWPWCYISKNHCSHQGE